MSYDELKGIFTSLHDDEKITLLHFIVGYLSDDENFNNSLLKGISYFRPIPDNERIH